jgi:concanavalin A-like lectin/glucanase superfamily protein/HYDIN/CFA65/VesB family protein/CARDB protein/flagellar hook capping protein FlgD
MRISIGPSIGLVCFGLLLHGGASAQLIGNYGKGTDGNVTVGSVMRPSISRALPASLPAGASTISGVSLSGFGPTDELLLWQAQGAGVGTYEFVSLDSISGGVAYLHSPTQNTYSSGSGNNHAVLARVPNYHLIRVQSGGVLAPETWTGTSGGVLVFRADSAVVIESGGSVDASGTGYRGGSQVSSTNPGFGQQGESVYGPGALTWVRNDGGGGGSYENVGCCTEGAGGGGFGAAGANGVDGAAQGPGQGGNVYGSNTLAGLFLGSGGGSGECGSTSRTGGAGGGLVMIVARRIIVNNGRMFSSGSSGTASCWGGGAGGSGGMIVLGGDTLSLGPNWITALGGAGGSGGGGSTNTAGGAGGLGRIVVNGVTISGTTNPPATENPNAPRISFSPDSLVGSLAAGDSLLVPATISNSGDGLLSWTVREDQALAFDGVNDYVDLGAWSPGSRWSVEAWVKPSSLPAGRRMIAGGANDCRDWGIALSDGHFGIPIRPASEACAQTVTSAGSAAPGTWYHVVGTNDGQTARLYVNGAEVGSAQVSASYSGTTAGTRIGGEACCPGNNFPGAIDEVRIWNRALTYDEVKGEFTRAHLMPASGLIGYWNFDDLSSTAVPDESGLGHDGTLAGGAARVGSTAPLASFLSASPTTGSVPIGSATPISTKLNARDLVEGEYTTTLVIGSNDPQKQVLAVPTRITVSGIPRIAVSRDSLSFSDVLLNSTAVQAVQLRNIGTGNLTLSAGTASGDFSVASAVTQLRPGQSDSVAVSFAPSGIGVRTGALTVATNDPARDTVRIALVGTGAQSITFNLDVRRLQRLGLFRPADGMRPILDIVNSASVLMVDDDADSVWAATITRSLRAPLSYIFAIDPNGNGLNDGGEWVFERGGATNARTLGVSDSNPISVPASMFDDLPVDSIGAGYEALVTRSFRAGNGAPISFSVPGQETYVSLDIDSLDQASLISIRRYPGGIGLPPPSGIAIVGTNVNWGIEISPAAASISARLLVQYSLFSGISDPTALRVLHQEAISPTLTVLPTQLNLNTRSLLGLIARSVGEGRSKVVFGSTTSANSLAPQAPDSITNPSPAPGAVDVALKPRLSWFPAGGALTYDVYLWRDGQSIPNSPIAADLHGTSHQVTSPLAYGVLYQWRVVAKNLDGSTSSVGWSFTTDRQPDLIVADLQGPGDAFSDQVIQVTWQTRNDGERSTRSETWLDGVYLSPSEIFDPGSSRLLVALDNLSSLNIGQAYTRTAMAHLPRDISGSYFLFVFADAYDRVSEQIDTNNVLSKPILVSLTPQPDLQVTTVTIPPAAFSDDVITIGWSAHNLGAGPTLVSNWSDDVYISADAILDNGDPRLGTVRHTGALEAGQSYTASLAGRLPHALYGTLRIFVVTDTRDEVYEHVFETNNDRNETIQVTVSPPPDLVVTQMSAPLNGDAAHPIHLEWTVENQGPGGTFESSWEDRIYFSSDATFNPETAVLLGRTSHFGGIPAGGSYIDAADVALPKDSGGPKYIWVQADGGGAVFEYLYEGNNLTRSDTTCFVAWPDLDVVTVTAPSAAQSGQTITVNWSTSNVGPGPLIQRGVSDRVYLSMSPVLDPVHDLELGTFPRLLTLTPGATSVAQQNVVIPNGTNGPRYLYVWSDWDDRIGEGGAEQNNVGRSDTLHVDLTPWPNLVVTDVSSPSTAVAGQQFSLSWQVRNEGVAVTPGGSWIDRAYLSRDSTWSSDGALLLGGVIHSGQLMPDGSYGATLSTTLPVTLGAGTYYAYVRTDDDNAIYEHTDEGDNRGRGDALALSGAPGADLVVEDYAPPDSAASGTTLQLHWAVRNAGPGVTLAQRWNDAVYLSTDATPSTETDYRLAVVPRNASLPASSGYVRDITVSIPNGISGDYWLIVVADADGQVNDPDVSNNVASGSPLHVRLTPTSDLSVPTLDAPGTAALGHTVPITWSVRNGGVAAARPFSWFDAVYLSIDPFIDAGDLKLGTIVHDGGLPQDSSYAVSLDVEIPPLTAEGTYYWIVKADSRNDVYEHEAEVNNDRVLPVFVEHAPPADLVVSSILGPASVVPGDDLTLSWTLANVGANPARGSIRDAVYLSGDTTWSLDDPLAGVLDRTVDITSGGFYSARITVSTAKLSFADASGSVTRPAPSLTPGRYFVIVRTNLRRTLEESDYSNNTSVGDSLNASLAMLTLGNRELVPLVSGQSRYFKLDVPESEEGKTLQLLVDSDRPDFSNEVYLRYGEAPTASIFDYKSDIPFRAAQQLAVPTLAAGTYYVLLHTRAAPDTEVVSVLARAVGFGVNAIVPAEGGQGGRITVRFDGTGLQSDPTVILEGPGVSVRAVATFHVSATESYATFDLAGVPLGVYDVIIREDLSHFEFHEDITNAVTIERDSTEVRLPEAFSVVPPVRRPVEILLKRPGVLRQYDYFETALYVRNNSNNDISCPLVSLSTYPDILTTLRGRAEASFGERRFLCLSPDGPAGVLRPGGVSLVRIGGYAPSHGLLVFKTRVLSSNGVIQYSFDDQLRSLGLSPDDPDWADAIAKIRLRAGGNWLSFQELLAEAATDISRLGLSDSDPSSLLIKLLADAQATPLSLEAPPGIPNLTTGSSPQRQGDSRQAPTELLAAQGIAPPGSRRCEILKAACDATNCSQEKKESDNDWLRFVAGQFYTLCGTDASNFLHWFVNERHDPYPISQDSRLGNDIAHSEEYQRKVELSRRYANARIRGYASGSCGNGGMGDFDMSDDAEGQIGRLTFTRPMNNRLPINDCNPFWAIHSFQQFDARIANIHWTSSEPSKCERGCRLVYRAQLVLTFTDNYSFDTDDICTTPVFGCYAHRRSRCGNTGFKTVFTATYPIHGVIEPEKLPCGNPDPGDTSRVAVSVDPNDIVGPGGVGDGNWIAGNASLTYTIHFENDPTRATAPAQTVVIEQVLDPRLDIRSFRLGRFGFGGLTFDVPANRSSYAIVLDVRESLGVFVDVLAGIDVTQNRAFWTFRSIDPGTGQVPGNPLIGFLAPNDSLGHGEGFVTYTIGPTSTSATGDSVFARAQIVFDRNEPLETEEIFNVFDTVPPSTRVRANVEVIDSVTAVLHLVGSDVGSGLRASTLYVSTGTGAFEPFSMGLTDTTVSFTVEVGKTYRLFSIGTDLVGNMEPMKSEAEAYVLTGVTGIEATEAAPRVLTLGPFAPNPAGSEVGIRYGLPKTALVSIRIFDVQGRLVRQLRDSVEPAGYHEARWDGRSSAGGRVASGIYFLRLEVGGRKLSGRIVMLK